MSLNLDCLNPNWYDLQANLFQGNESCYEQKHLNLEVI